MVVRAGLRDAGTLGEFMAPHLFGAKVVNEHSEHDEKARHRGSKHGSDDAVKPDECLALLAAAVANPKRRTRHHP